MTKTRTINGLVITIEKEMRVVGGRITVRVTKYEHGQSISLADEQHGIMLEIPVEPVADMLEVK